MTSTNRSKPTTFDRNLVVIGGGSAGLVSAYIAAALKARVTLVEAHRMGGDCLNTGCVPSKALIRTTRFLAEARRARDLGLDRATVEFDFATVMERVQRVIDTVAPHDSVERYTALGVDCIEGRARLLSPWEVEVNGRVLTTRSVIIATGGEPVVPAIPGIDEVPHYTSEDIWSLRDRPDHLLVLGGGPIACEMAQCFVRLGSRVTMVEQAERILGREDPEFSELLTRALVEEGVEVLTGHQARGFSGGPRSNRARLRSPAGKDLELEFSHLLVAVGRRARTADLGLENAGIEVTDSGHLAVDRTLRTAAPNIYGAGDVVAPYQFTHTASHEAWYAAVNALLGGLWRFRVNYDVIPWVTFTEPEIARVGLSELEARQRGLTHEVTRYAFAELDRAIADEDVAGEVKVVTRRGSDYILGATIAGPGAGELITEFVTALKNGWGLNRILGTIHAYPTLSEANRNVAGVWRRGHAPQRLLGLLARFHRWRLGPPTDIHNERQP